MPRVIAGSAGGRPLVVPKGARPTADRVKEALFSSLGPMHDAIVADLYGGSGGLAIEALSRGAIGALVYESNLAAAKIIATNAKVAGVEDRLKIIAKPCEKAPIRHQAGRFTHIFADPPYDYPIASIEHALEQLISCDAISSQAILILERDKRRAGDMPKGWSLLRERVYGEALIRYGERLQPVQNE